ncbi:hypothetical protein ASE63_01995 [Bosea sp. Root381]|uniref:DUF2946 family protein n=1 Tax=Bosea sp. Root381 TaxID=1736524 RepID=UPI0006F50D61|nr:DUF2946 family protein [Bosea sp. Root381]KRE17985.1 hypothetical protein ASE63_01995 [Bosea sp. Root381]
MRGWVAIAAAYLLVLQAVVAGLASGAHAADRVLAQSLGMTLCSPLGSHDPGAQGGASGQEAGQPDMMEHCRTACALASNVLVPTSDTHVAVVYRDVDRVAFARQLDTPQGYVGGRSPANPRAPPSRA